ncbi:MAG: type II toxin-antitoxin system VapC family toxin [Nitrospinota bacterium]|nr:MAG: type II toxin-antitoxin system VapC family toxin [Nitrospinota bacterium]
MVLVDTSVWISHLREGNRRLAHLLEAGFVLCHPCIIGELACGNLQHRKEILSLLQALPMAIEATHAEAMECIERQKLMGKGLGYIDIHLLASAMLTGVPLWTLDRRLSRVALALGIGYP